MIKHLLNIFLLSVLNVSFGQYSLDDTIKAHPFLNKVFEKINDTEGPIRCSYYEHNGYKTVDNCTISDSNSLFYASVFEPEKVDAFLLQERLKDTLRNTFNNNQYFEIAKYSKIPFYRLIAFELYTQCDYDKKSVIQFLKSGEFPCNSVLFRSPEESDTPELFTPISTNWSFGFGYQQYPIRLKMLEMIDPSSFLKQRRCIDSTNWDYINVPKFPLNKKLEYEEFVELRGFMNNLVCQDLGSVYEGMPSFILTVLKYDFGIIDLSHLDKSSNELILRGYIKLINNNEETIHISSKASANTTCLKSTYSIKPKEEIFIDFKSLVNIKNIGPSIEGSITLQNVKSGEAQLFKFTAQFIHE